MDKKRLNHEEAPEIKQGEIDAWNRGKGDAMRDKLLAASRTLTPKRAVALVKMFANLGDIHYVSMKFDVSADEVRRVLNAFDIRSIEDAKTIVREGVIAELDDAEAVSREQDEAQNAVDYVEAQKRLDEQQAALEEPVKTVEEIDQTLAKRRDEAQRMNKEDRLRQLIAEGLDPATGTRSFRIPLADKRRFTQMIPHGVYQLQRTFGGSKADIVSEIKRLAPEYDVDMLRP